MPDGSTEIYISHRGAEEVLTGPQKEITTWTDASERSGPGSRIPGRLMAQLTGDKGQGSHARSSPTPRRKRSTPSWKADKVVVDEGFDRAWRRVGLALDRVGFTVEDRDRVQGIYFVRYVDPDSVNKEGFFSKLFGNEDKNKEAQRYRVLVSPRPRVRAAAT